jgi:hypothetical protein
MEEGVVFVPSKVGGGLIIPKQLFSGPQSVEDGKTV